MEYTSYTPSSDKFSEVAIGDPFEYNGEFYLKIEEIFSAKVEGDSSLPEEEPSGPSPSDPAVPASEGEGEDEFEWEEYEEEEGDTESSENTTVLTPIANAINFRDGSSVLIGDDEDITLVDYELRFGKRDDSSTGLPDGGAAG